MFILRRRRCYSCGARESLKKCRCGHLFCPLHGVGELCADCYSKSLVSVPEVARAETKSAGTAAQRDAQEAGQVVFTSRLVLESFDRERAMQGIYRTMLKYRFMCMAQTDVELEDKEGPVVLVFQKDRIVNIIESRLLVVTVKTYADPALSRLVEQVGSSLQRIGQKLSQISTSQRYDLYRSILHHNEISWLAGVILTAMGWRVVRAEMEYRLTELPLATFGPLCPFCGVAISAKKGRCRNCGRQVPDDYPADEFIRSHLRRQFTDKLVALQMRRRELEVGPEEYARSKMALTSLRDSVSALEWTGYEPVHAR